jgi:diaminopimelate decarboxylase
MLRLAVRDGAGIERTRLVGDDGAGKFGMELADVREGAGRIARSRHLRLVGLHAFGASNVLDANTLLAHARGTVRAAQVLAGETRVPLEVVDVGGGLGIPYEDDEEPLDIEALGAGFASLIDEMAGDPLLAGARLLVEPGRWLVGPAGAYLTRVVDRKVVGGREVAIVDGGIHHVLRPALVRQEHRVVAFPASSTANGRQEGHPPRPVTIAGPLCSGLDLLARNVRCGDVDVGTLVAVLDVGAYGFTESMPLFLSHAVPPEIAIRGGRAEVIRPRQEPEDWLRCQRVPDW